MNAKSSTLSLPRSTALGAVARLREAFPHLEVGAHEARAYLDGFFTDGAGFPYLPADRVAWEEEGCLIALRAPQIVWWVPYDRALVPSDSEEEGIALLFVHEDGQTYAVDESDGTLHPLFFTPYAEVLAYYLRLFFGEGRADLIQKGLLLPQKGAVKMLVPL